jgi:hypothetical protein
VCQEEEDARVHSVGMDIAVEDLPEADMLVLRCGGDEGAIRIQGNGGDIISMASPGIMDLLPC